MPRIRCRYEECIFLDGGFCTAERIELDPEMGCLTFQQADEAVEEEVAWEEEEEELEEEEVLDEEEEEELDWDEDEDDEDKDDEW
jgi:hypothetical protein